MAIFEQEEKKQSDEVQINTFIKVPEDNERSILSADPQIQRGGLRKLSKELQAMFKQCVDDKRRIKLENEKKQTVLFVNSRDGNIFFGQNDSNLWSYNVNDFEEISQMQIPAEAMSILSFGGFIYLGLNNDSVCIYDIEEMYDFVKDVKTSSVPLKIIPYIHQHQNRSNESKYIVFLEKDGFIEFFSIEKMEIIFRFQHSCKFSIQDAIQVINKNEICIGFAQLIDNAYKDGKLSFIEIIFNDQKAEEEISIEEIEEVEQFNKKSVFCIQQISLNCFVVCVVDKSMKVFNRLKPKIIQDIHNPSQSIFTYLTL
ncbi:UNKNOWN [Stylonychia lemnae]|uniref:Uncharacterized protein n=1 Tax=Stylonychia lemnae TaxID=5949 RepID=A0A078AWW7_STYLE|nr:UNKNOWN [Stylonychia lemnae]|eukprot:CDW86925.1 UNKNOWN [Stylonychia lemnae]